VGKIIRVVDILGDILQAILLDVLMKVLRNRLV